MKRMIVALLEKSSVGLVIVLLLIGFFAGYQADGIATAVVGLLMASVVAVLVFGILFVQLEMNESLRAIRGELEKRAV